MSRRSRLVLGISVATLALAQACSCSDEGEEASNVPGTGGQGTGGSAGDASQDGLIFPDGSGGDTSVTCPGGCPEGRFASTGSASLRRLAPTTTTARTTPTASRGLDASRGVSPRGRTPIRRARSACLPGISLQPSSASSAPPAGDPFPNHKDVQATPVVVNFNAPGQGPPSIVSPFTATVVSSYTENQGVVRVLRGDNCQLEANLAVVRADTRASSSLLRRWPLAIWTATARPRSSRTLPMAPSSRSRARQESGASSGSRRPDWAADSGPDRPSTISTTTACPR